MLIYADEDVPEDVVQFFLGRPHRVQHVRAIFMPGERDYVIARAAVKNGAVVLTWNARDFKKLAHRRGSRDGLPSYPTMSLITFSCRQPQGLTRLQKIVGVVEAAYVILVQEGGGRMIADVGDTVLRFED